MTTAEFLERFEEFLGRNGRRSASPWTLVEAWESLTEEAHTGYHSNIYEFDDEVGVRDLLERAFVDPALVDHEIIRLMRERVVAADNRLRTAFLPGLQIGAPGEPWWHRGVLARAGQEYAEDASRLYDVSIDVVT